ncbi:MAG: preprotein translocase subunit SecA [Candidatus Omnitrophica bacterium]|nr:preprotein translocase subunit SecA [Candidatus Omnitrophota bacterium]
MVQWVLKKVFGSHNVRALKRFWPVVDEINRLEPRMQALSDEQLRATTAEFRERLRQRLAQHKFVEPGSAEWYELGFEDRQKLKRQRRAAQMQALDELLPEVFAVVREAARRTVNMRHFDVQLVGGMVLHSGRIAEMATGEGKTLVATLAAYLNALVGRGVHIVTVNDYLARRDARWMGPIYHALGLSVGVIQGVEPAERRFGDQPLSFVYEPGFDHTSERFAQLRPAGRREAYEADITYGQNNEFGFDYLRDNMRLRLDDRVQRAFHYAIVDEVDSILVDEARTPLIISGPAEESTELYYRLDRVVRQLTKDTHYELDEKQRAVSLTEAGIERCEGLLSVANLYDEMNIRLVHHLNQALRAHEMFKLDVDYMIKDGEVIIVDEFTGRLMPGRRWSDGLHQAIEAKEGVRIREENQTLASVTFQNYFRMYEKLAGMTGTAATEAQEFRQIYTLDVDVIPTNRSLNRITYPDVVYKTEAEKFLAVVQEIVDYHRRGQPVLVGTISIEKSERVSRMLKEPAPLLARMQMTCQWALDELKKEPIPESLKPALTQLFSRPAALDPRAADELLARLKEQAPKSMLVYRVEDLIRLHHTVESVRAGVPHNVLNAKYHEQEARIVAQAGRFGAVTIATNMAGRGTDILLGGNPQFLAEDAIREREAGGQTPLAEEEKRAIAERFQREAEEGRKKVVELGGLHMLGTERHEARRIDNQLRGRAGRQGDPGSSRFYLSLGDDLMRIFGSDRIAKIMELKWFRWEEGLPIEHPWITKSVETAQRRVEAENFEARKHLLEYDNVMNRQREVIYEQRTRFLEGVELKKLVEDIIEEVAEEFVETYAPKEGRQDAWDLEGLQSVLQKQFAVDFSLNGQAQAASHDRAALFAALRAALAAAYQTKEQAIGNEIMRHLERNILLGIMDTKWKDHLYMMDALRDGINLRAYGQRDPLVEYQHEAYAMFQRMVAAIKSDSLAMLLRIQPREGPPPGEGPGGEGAQPPAAPVKPQPVFDLSKSTLVHQEASSFTSSAAAPPGAPAAAVRRPPSSRPSASPPELADLPPGPPSPVQRSGPKVGRNDPCPCGRTDSAGKRVKYKKCCYPKYG